MNDALMKLMFGVSLVVLAFLLIHAISEQARRWVREDQDTVGRMAIIFLSTIPIAIFLICGLFLVMTAFMPM